MEIRKITFEDFDACVRAVSLRWYSNNVITDDGNRGWGPRTMNLAGTAFRCRVRVADSSGPGARRSWTGRRMPAACWHVFRDVVRHTLHVHPQAVFRTAMARYDVENFERTYPATGYVNIGSQVCPVTMPQLCNCTDGAPGMEPRLTNLAPVTDWERVDSRVEAVLNVKPGECGWCGQGTGGSEMIWCSPGCQERWQEKYSLSPTAG